MKNKLNKLDPEIRQVSTLKPGDKFKEINKSFKDDTIFVVRTITKYSCLFNAEDGGVELGMPSHFYVERIP